MTADDLEARLKRVEDVQAIKDLRARYCFAVDEGRWDDLIAMFTEDAEVNMLGTAKGRAELLPYFRDFVSGSLDNMWHFVHNETIRVDGDHAAGEAMVEVPCVADGQPRIIAAKYYDEFERVDGQWLFKKRSSRSITTPLTTTDGSRSTSRRKHDDLGEG